jgi:hypothetical protein
VGRVEFAPVDVAPTAIFRGMSRLPCISSLPRRPDDRIARTYLSIVKNDHQAILATCF